MSKTFMRLAGNKKTVLERLDDAMQGISAAGAKLRNPTDREAIDDGPRKGEWLSVDWKCLAAEKQLEELRGRRGASAGNPAPGVAEHAGSSFSPGGDKTKTIPAAAHPAAVAIDPDASAAIRVASVAAGALRAAANAEADPYRRAILHLRANAALTS